MTYTERGLVPNGSSTTIRESSGGRSITVGVMKYPGDGSIFPPHATFHPCFSISSKKVLTRSNCMLFCTGPWLMPGCEPSPSVYDWTCLTRAALNGS